jgi:hypothetical protein
VNTWGKKWRFAWRLGGGTAFCLTATIGARSCQAQHNLGVQSRRRKQKSEDEDEGRDDDEAGGEHANQTQLRQIQHSQSALQCWAK